MSICIIIYVFKTHQVLLLTQHLTISTYVCQDINYKNKLQYENVKSILYLIGMMDFPKAQTQATKIQTQMVAILMRIVKGVTPIKHRIDFHIHIQIYSYY